MQNLYDRRAEWGPTYFDVRHSFTTSFFYELPFGKGRMLGSGWHPVVNGFLGQTTGFFKNLIKPAVTILGEVEGTNEVKYVHSNYGKGTITYLGGHDPEDYQHAVGDPPTNLALHKNSPGYRLILNNILFPAAEKKERKT